MKKSSLLILALVLILAALALTACNQKPHTHAFGDWKIVKEATCTEDGTKEATCSCGEKKTETIPATGHNFVDKVCDRCGEPKLSEGLSYTLNSDGQSYTVSGIGTCTDNDLIIPSVYEGKPVTNIGRYAFQDKGLISVTIPDSVTSIGDGAFKGCTGLTSITIPDSVTSIGVSALYGTAYYNNESNWTDGVLYIGNYLITAKDSVSGSYIIKSGTKCIAAFAFSDCKGLTSITIPDSVTSIGEAAFRFCTGLTSITIPESVKSIGMLAFYSCNGLTSVTIPDSVTDIGMLAFYRCAGLNSITIGNSVTSIGAEAFCDTAYYSNESNWADGVLYIGNYLIKAKDSVSGSYTVKAGTVCIADSAFEGCKDLTSITIPDSVTSVGSYAFWKCTDLTSITIPDSVTNIGESAFRTCKNLTSITFKGTKAQWNTITKENDWDTDTGDYTVHCTDGDIEK